MTINIDAIMKIVVNFTLLWGGMLVFGTPLGLYAQYETQMRRMLFELREVNCVSSSALLEYWLENPSFYHEGLNLRIVHEYYFVLPDTIKDPIIDPQYFLAQLSPQCYQTDNRRFFSLHQEGLYGRATGWFEGDSMIYYCSLGEEKVYISLKENSRSFYYYEELEALGVEIIFSVPWQSGGIVFGLSRDQLWVAKSRDSIVEIMTWEQFMSCCQDEFWYFFPED